MYISVADELGDSSPLVLVLTLKGSCAMHALPSVKIKCGFWVRNIFKTTREGGEKTHTLNKNTDMFSESITEKQLYRVQKSLTNYPIRDITDKLRKYFSGHLVAPNKKLRSKFWFRATKCPVNVQKMLNVCFRATIWTEKYLRDLSVMSLLGNKANPYP